MSFLVPDDRIQLSQEILETAIGEEWGSDEVDAAVELLLNGDGRFPAGARKLPTDLVKAVQRERLIRAMLSAASQLGYREANVQDVIELAGVSRPTFYEHFSNKEDCFLAAFDTSAERLRGRVDAAVGRGGEIWRERVRLGLEALLDFVAEEPRTARTLVVEARAGSAAAVQRRMMMLDGFAACLDAQAREFLPDSVSSPITAPGVVGGVESLLYSRLCKDEHENLGSLLPSLMYFVVLPYEGHEAAGEEFALEAS